jgi:hypothetical protein
MAYKLRCPECFSDRLEQHFTEKQRTEKFKCKECGKVSKITQLTYDSIFGDDPSKDLEDLGGYKTQEESDEEED